MRLYKNYLSQTQFTLLSQIPQERQTTEVCDKASYTIGWDQCTSVILMLNLILTWR